MALKIWLKRTMALAKHREREQEARAKKEQLEIWQVAREEYSTSLFPDIAAGKQISLLIESRAAEIVHLERETHWAAHNADKQRAKVESLRLQRDGATPKVESVLVSELGVRMRVFGRSFRSSALSYAARKSLCRRRVIGASASRRG
ncbi:hypothetical protein LZ31DRAFT_127956 [Colletotrichum somersetense]|nr:hypothetical protein LZ31DRAFT_127956 [Colletotrichum somersetense]